MSPWITLAVVLAGVNLARLTGRGMLIAPVVMAVLALAAVLGWLPETVWWRRAASIILAGAVLVVVVVTALATVLATVMAVVTATATTVLTTVTVMLLLLQLHRLLKLQNKF